MTITGEHSTDIDRLRADLMRICKHHIGFFGGSIPFDSYLFLTLATSKDYGGLEHKKSYPQLLGIVLTTHIQLMETGRLDGFYPPSVKILV
jgi:predicted metalloprotease with PDZ domain